MLPPPTTTSSLYSSSSSLSLFSSSSSFPLPVPKVKTAAAISQLRWLNQNQNLLIPTTRSNRRRRGICCRAELSQEAPFAIAMGACMLNSLLFPQISDKDEDEEETLILGPNDYRFLVMTIISFIPFFNWLSWVFAFMDTGNRRYALYAAVYLAPYLRTNLSLSPEESWLPIATIVLCIIHIQLEASINNGDLDAFTFLNEAAKRFGLGAGSKDDHPRRPGKKNKGRLSSRKARSKDETGKWSVPRKPSGDLEHEDSDVDDGTQH